MKRFETSIAFIETIESNIIVVRLKEDITISNVGLEENLAVFKNILNGGKGLFLVVFQAFSTAGIGLRSKYEDKQRVKLKRAEAFVVSSLSNRIELAYHIKNTQKNYPIKFFTEESEALSWLKTFTNNNITS